MRLALWRNSGSTTPVLILSMTVRFVLLSFSDRSSSHPLPHISSGIRRIPLHPNAPWSPPRLPLPSLPSLPLQGARAAQLPLPGSELERRRGRRGLVAEDADGGAAWAGDERYVRGAQNDGVRWIGRDVVGLKGGGTGLLLTLVRRSLPRWIFAFLYS